MVAASMGFEVGHHTSFVADTAITTTVEQYIATVEYMRGLECCADHLQVLGSFAKC